MTLNDDGQGVADERLHVLGCTQEELAAACAALGEPAYRAGQVLQWVYAKSAGDFGAMSNLSKGLRAKLAERWAIRTARQVRRQVSGDGTVKLLLAWPDGATSECVLIPDDDRRTACISSQVGCPVRCAFCASGLAGLERQLSAGQIVEQAMWVRDLADGAAGGDPQDDAGRSEQVGAEVQREGLRNNDAAPMHRRDAGATHDDRRDAGATPARAKGTVPFFADDKRDSPCGDAGATRDHRPDASDTQGASAATKTAYCVRGSPGETPVPHRTTGETLMSHLTTGETPVPHPNNNCQHSSDGAVTRDDRQDAKAGAGRALSNIVLMGLGEPLANYAAVVRAIRIMNASWGMHIGARGITLSTVGLPSQMRRLAEEGLPINLAISLHAPNDELRRRIIPWAEKIPIAEILAAARYYFERTGREITFEYILLAGVNDGPGHAMELAGLCRQVRCNVNLIRYNPVAGLPFGRPTSQATQHMVQILRGRGVNVHVRKSRGLDIDAACGQLRRSTESVARMPGD